jgi:hypothetical protein
MPAKTKTTPKILVTHFPTPAILSLAALRAVANSALRKTTGKA